MSTEVNPLESKLPVVNPPDWVGKPVGGPGATETTILRTDGDKGVLSLCLSSYRSKVRFPIGRAEV